MPISFVPRAPEANRMGEAYLLQAPLATQGMGMKGRYITGANANTPGYLEIVTELKHRIEAGEIVSKKKAVEWMTSKKSEANFAVED